ncbi:MAG: sulfite exporter TauE/SafE family protein, partial [Betaproteobacteria bacterium]|nr:sulfite exporter TauE/SafE family protein [Betaproteobacteria bacterium]
MLVLFILLVGVVAALYASVGHGGASGYLAIMALFGVSAVFMR